MKKILAAILFCCFCLGVIGFSACKRSGQQEKPISSSGEESNISDSSSGEHEYGELIAEIPATCEEEGVKAHYHCDHCGKDFDEAKQLIEDLVIPALGHDYGELIAEKPATCEGEGVKAHYHCDHCGKNFDEEKQLIEDLVIPALGHNYGEWIEEVPATATEPGTKGHYHCDHCGKNFDEEKHLLEDLVIPASGHDYGEWIAEQPATCEEEGVKAHYHCNICGKDFDEDKHPLEDLVIPALGHNYGELIAETPATCEEEGVKAHYHCNRCGKDFDEDKQLLEDLAIPALGHDWGEPEYIFVEDGSTCTAERICKRDAAHKETATAIILHEVTKEATCTEKGETTYTATFEEDWAEEQILKVEDIAELGHNYGELIAEIPATCEEEGVKAHYHCDRCGKDFDEDKQLLEDLVISALGHNYGEWIEEVPATETENGTKGHYHCDRCGKNFDEDKHLLEDLIISTCSHDTMPEVGETITFGNYHEATEWIVLDEDGDKTLIIAKDIIEVKPYNEQKVDITWENCTLRAWLNSEYINTAFSPEERNRILMTHVVNDDNPNFGTEGGNDTDDKVFLLSEEEARKHFADNAARMAKGTAYAESQGLGGGDTGYWWLRSPGYDSQNVTYVNWNGDIFKTDVDDSYIGVRPVLWVDFVHSWDEGSITKEPTCIEKGSIKYTCMVCGKTRSDVIPALGHKWNEGEVTKAATCTEDGTMKYICTVCGETKEEIIKAAGHKWNEGEVTKAATCTEDGTTKYICMVCGEEKEEIVSALGHNYGNWIPKVPATETAPGTKGHYHCDRCEKDFDALYNVLEDLVIPAGSQAVIPEVGETMLFGNYHEATEWIVLAKDEDKTLIISKDVIEVKPYNEQKVDTTWEECTLRTWLNNEYINTAFSEEERNRILTTHVVNDDNPNFGTEGGNDTDDKVFLLSEEEARKHFADNAARMAKGTAYAESQGLGGGDTGYWWLRSPGYDSQNVTYVNWNGDIFKTDVDCSYIGVRPALWISNQ